MSLARDMQICALGALSPRFPKRVEYSEIIRDAEVRGMFWKRTKIWLQYAKRNRWQAVGFLLFGIIPLAIFHLLQRQIEVWEDAYLDKHGTSTAASAFVVVVDFIAHHPIWSIILFAVSVILGLLIHAYIATHPFHEYEKEAVSHDRPEESGSPEGQKQRETHGKPVAGQLPEYRPLVIPAEYGRNSERSSYGLFIVNPGYTALEVHIPTVGVASSGYTLVFPPKLTQFGERDHKCFMEAWLEHPTLPGRDGGQLSNVMRTANIDSLNFVIRYKDLDSVWYKSNCRIELDVSLQSGLRAIFLGQALLGDNPEELQESPPSAEMIHAVHVELTPSQGQADRMYLEVENSGEKQTFHAQCRVLARRNDPNPQRLLTLDLGWVRNKARELEIRRGETCSLYVARAGQGRTSRDMEWIEIVGSPERVQSQWAIGQVTPLPEYDVEIVIFGGENQQPYSEKFTIRAGRNAHWRCLSSKPTRRYGRMLVQAGHSCI